MQTNHLIVPTFTAAILFEKFIKGQLSDGMWENATPQGHWVAWSNTQAIVNETAQPHTSIYGERPRKTSYRLGALRAVVQEEMLECVRELGYPTYDVKQLIADMRAIQKGMRTIS